MKLSGFSRFFVTFAILSVFAVNVSLAQTSLLIVGADSTPPTAELTATGRFSVVDFFNATTGTPSLATLSSYDSVLVYSNSIPFNAVALGDVMADYVDSGGKLTISTYLFSSPWAIQGRITTSGYLPLTNLGANGDVSGMLATTTTDPIFDGVNLSSVTYFHNENFAYPGVDVGASLLATDGSGINMIAVSSNRRVFGFNLFPGTNVVGNNAEFYNLLANSLVSGSIDSLQVAPWENFNSSGKQGGPFIPSSKTYTLTNTGPNSLDWTATKTSAWLDITSAGGTLNPGDSVTVDIVINANANSFPQGSYNDTVTFTNITSGNTQKRFVVLTVKPDQIFFDSFPTTTLDSSNWINTISVPTIDDFGIGEPSPLYSLRLNGTPDGGDAVESCVIDLSSMSSAELSYWWERTGGGEHPDPGEDLVVAYWNGSSWVELARHPGGDTDMTSYVQSVIALPAEALYGNFRLRISSTGTAGTYDDWFVDDVALTGVPMDDLEVAPAEGLNSSGNQGGPFTPVSKNYTLTNIGPNSLDWTAAATAPWIDLDMSSGTLAPGDSVMMAVSFNANADSLSPGDYNDIVTFTNITSGFVQTRQITLQVIAIPGELNITDSIPPADDLNMPFGETFINMSQTGQITIANTDPTYGLTITDISLGSGGYLEDFNDGLAQDWYEDIDASWQVIAGEYRAQRSATDWMMANYEAKQWEDLSVQMTCHRTGSSGNSAAVTLRATSDFDDTIGSGYVFQIATNGAYGIWKQVNGYFSWLQSWTSSPSITTGTNTLTAVAEGSLLKFFINGTLVWTGSDSELVSGRIGLGGYTSSGDATHYFDNVLVDEPITSAQIISDEQIWYNQHSYEGGEPQAVPTDWVPPPYPSKNKIQQQPAQKTSILSSDEAFRLENLPSLPLVIPPLGNVTIDVVFEPNSAKAYESAVVIKSNDTDESEAVVKLTGTGILDYLQITPQQDFEFSGHPGGPFLPSKTSYNLTNTGPVQIDWILTCPDWLNANIASGTIKPLETIEISVTPNALARSKPEGVYTNQFVFTNSTTTAQHTRNIILNISTEPKAWITPYSFDVNVYQGDIGSKILTIGNGGDGLLNFMLRGKQTSFTPAASTVGIYNSMVETKKDIAAMAPAKHSFTAMKADKAFAKGRMLVRFAPEADRKYPGLAAKNSILTKAGNGKLKTAQIAKEYKHVKGLSLIKLPNNISVEDALVTLNNTPGILYAEPDYQVKALSGGQTIPNDPLFSELWGLNNTGQNGGTPDADIDAPEAWDIATGSNQIIVAVIDTGVDYTHPDLASNMWVNSAEFNGTPGVDDDGNGYIDDIYGYDFVNNDGNPMDDHYHGTHVAGTIGGVGNNGQGVAGVCWNVKIMALKFLDSSGSGYDSDAIECIQYAILMGANLSSNSWGGGGYSQSLKDAIDAAGNANQLFIAAAGNNYGNNNDINPSYPASYTSENIISVLATDRYDNMSSFSNYGPTSVDIGAPGSDILSCQPGSNYQYLNGTSMATPHVSGAAALVWSFSPSMPYQDVKNLLIQTADKTPAMAGRCVAEGRLNLYNAINESGISWLEFVPQSGSVLPGEVNNVSVLFNGDAPVGTYQGLITVSTNDPYTPETDIPVTMTVERLDYFTELFDAGDNDMANRTLTFIPNNSVKHYNLCTEQASAFPVNPAGGTTVTLNDDDYYEVQLQGHAVKFYGTNYDTFYIGSNGYITFESGDTHYFEQLAEHFALPRIAALFDDLNPLTGGTISYKELADRVVVTFQNIHEFSQIATNSFQIEMFFYGKIRITFLNIAAVDGLTGLSQGNGVPVYYSESNLSEYDVCQIPAGGDFDADGDIDMSDLFILVGNWLRDDCAPLNWCDGTDLNQNGLVNFTDFSEFANHWEE